MQSHPIIVIDPGHGGHSQLGKSTPIGERSLYGLTEKDFTLALANRVAAHSSSEAVLTRYNDTNLSLGNRCQKAQAYGAAVFVSLHANGRQSGIEGPEVIVHNRAGSNSHSLAQEIRQELSTSYGSVRPMTAAEMAVLNPEHLPTDTAACMIEVDSLVNTHGNHRLSDPSNIDSLGQAIARGVNRYAGRQDVMAEGQQVFPLITGIVGIGSGLFSVVKSLVEIVRSGGLVWSRNVTSVKHDYPKGKNPNKFHDRSFTIFDVNCEEGVSDAYAKWIVTFRANGNDIDQCQVELAEGGANDWTSSEIKVTFEGSNAYSYEVEGKKSIGHIMMNITGDLDPAGTGDISFKAKVLVIADGRIKNMGFEVTRGDKSDFNYIELKSHGIKGGYRIVKT